jgi:glutamate dehydrogenase (NAD(P)+)
MSQKGPSPYEIAVQQFDRAAEYLDLKAGIREMLRRPKRELTVNFPVKMDDGSVRVFTGHRVHHSVVLGPTKGGIRYHPDVTLDDVEVLCRRAALRGSQRRRRLQPKRDVTGRAGKPHAAVCL